MPTYANSAKHSNTTHTPHGRRGQGWSLESQKRSWGSRENPIIIGDETSQKKQRTSEKPRLETTHQNSSMSKNRSLEELVRLSKRIVVITGAGVSANSKYSTFQEMRMSKSTSSTEDIASFHSTACAMFKRLQSEPCQPTKFHIFLDELARSGQLQRHFTQNVDCIEQGLSNLDTRTTRLHGQINQSRCQKCNGVYEFEPKLFQGSNSPDCQRCIQRSQVRISRRMRAHSPEKLRSDVLLYGDINPDDKKIFQATEESLANSPDLLIVAGSRLDAPGATSMVENLCCATRRSGGFTVWISKEKPLAKLQYLFDCIIVKDCDVAVSTHIPITLPPLISTASQPRMIQPRTGKLNIQQLGGYDDILTDTLVDRVYNLGTPKFRKSYQSTCEDQQSVISILRDVLIKRNDLTETERLQLDLPGLKAFLASLGSDAEKIAFNRHMKQYLKIYFPDCPFELSSTLRFTRTSSEAAITSRRLILKGQVIKYLCGTLAILTKHEETDLNESNSKYNKFSIIVSTRYQTASVMGGPARFANHDCKPNAEFISTGASSVQIVATKDINIGEEITVEYAKGYFGDNNRDCLCKTCEYSLQNGWAEEGSRTPGDYLAENLHAGNHIEGHGVSSLPCLACERHRKLYGYCWPKTKQEN